MSSDSTDIGRKLVSPNGFDGRGPVPERVTAAARSIARLRVTFVVRGHPLDDDEIEQLFDAAAITAEWSRELYEAVETLATTEAALAESRGEVAALKEELAAERLRNPLNARAVDDPDFVLPWNLEAPHESTPRKETK